MSRNQRRKGGSKHGRSDAWLADARDASSMYNAAFEAYYKGSVVPETEWADFVAAMRRPLPVAVRVNASSRCAEAVRRLLHSRLAEVAVAAAQRDDKDSNNKATNDIDDSSTVAAMVTQEVRVLPFYRPHGYALQCADLSRGTLKRHAPCRAVKCLLTGLVEGGYVSRQETVSMLPPLLLRVAPGHRVLDLCAAPGSKTCQLLEALLVQQQEQQPPPPPSCHGCRGAPSMPDGDQRCCCCSHADDAGVVVANDLNPSRLDVLHHQTNRIAGAHPRLVLTNYDALSFPLLPPAQRFDRVLCDVMCSGDGTLRKSMDLWPRWNVLQGADLHRTQCAALWRGMATCKTGALLVYSTCSLNPVEDEAVLSACLARARGCFELVNIDGGDDNNDDDDANASADASSSSSSSLLPGLRATPGLLHWSVLTRDLSTRLHSYAEAQAYTTAAQQQQQQQHRSNSSSTTDDNDTSNNNNDGDDAAATTRPPRRRPRPVRVFQYTESMFANTALLQQQHMTRARRILPHHNDTGGFFVALLRCVRALDADEGVMVGDNNNNNNSSSGSGNGGGCGSCPLQPLSDELRAAVQRALSLPDDFAYDRLLARGTVAREQKVYYATAAAAALARQLGSRVVHVGAKVFEACVKGSNAHLRVSSDGAVTAAAVLPPRAPFVVDVTPRLLLELCSSDGASSSSSSTAAAVTASMPCAELAARLGCGVDALPPYSGVLRCVHPLVGDMAVACERPLRHGGAVLTARVLPWHIILCRLALNLPLCDRDKDAKEDEEDDDDKDNSTAADDKEQTRDALDDAYGAFARSDVERACRTLDDAVVAAAQARADVENVFALCCVRASLAAMEGGGGGGGIAAIMSPARGAAQHAAATCYLEGLAALAKSNLQTARIKFSEARRRDRLFVVAALGLAAVHYELRQYRESFAQYREVLSVLGSAAAPAVVRVGMALCCYHLGRLDMAERCLECALARDAHDQLALLALLVVYVDKRRFSKVTEVVLQLRQLLPHNALVLLRVGDLAYFRAVSQLRAAQQQQQQQLQQQQQQQVDMAATTRALTALLDEVRRGGGAEECAMADFQHGRLLLLLGDLPGATQRLEAALHTLPTLLAARVHYARVLLLSGRSEDGLRLLAKLHREHASQKEVLQLLAVHATRHGQHAAALRYCRRLTESVAPDDVRAWALAAWCARLDGNTCGRLFRHVVRLHRELQMTPSWQMLANVAVLSKDVEALQALLDRELGGDFLHRGSSSSNSSNSGGDGSAHGEAVAATAVLEVRHVPLVYNLALLLEQHDTTRARQLYIFLVKQQSCFRAPYFRLHALACAAGQEQQAVAWLTLLLQVVPDEPTALAGIAERFFHHARYRTAMDILRNTRGSGGSGGVAGRRRGRDEGGAAADAGDAAAQRVGRSASVSLALAATYLWCAQRRGRDDRRFLQSAKERYAHVLRHDHGNVLAAHGIACCLALEGDYDHCQSLLSRVSEVAPNAAYVVSQQHVHMANAKMLSESYRQALDHLARAAPLTRQQRSLQAFCLAAEGQLDEACELLARAVDEQQQQQQQHDADGDDATRKDGSDARATLSTQQQQQPQSPQLLQQHLLYNVALLHCTAFVRHVAQSEQLTLEQGRALRGRLERGLSYALRFLRSSGGGSAGQSSVTRVCRVFLKSVCAYCVHVYETTLERLLLAGKESEVEQSREAQRWADTFAAYCAERNKDAEARVQREAQQRQVQHEMAREVLDGFRARREHDPIKLFDPDLVAASLAELDRQPMPPLPGTTDEDDGSRNDNDDDDDDVSKSKDDVQMATTTTTTATAQSQEDSNNIVGSDGDGGAAAMTTSPRIEGADALAHAMLAGMQLTVTASDDNDEGGDEDVADNVEHHDAATAQ